MPQFSVIVPLYNKAPYVRRALESVLHQTYQDFEIIVVDDGSSDGSAEIVAEINDTRIHLIRQENAGVSSARNNGVAASMGDYLCFIDADDWWEPTFLEEMSRLIERNPNAGTYGTGYYLVKNSKKRVAPVGVEDCFSEGPIDYCNVYAKTLCMPITSSSVCLPRETFNEQGGFPIGIKLGEDFLLWIGIALSHDVVFLNKPLSNYNQDADPRFRGIGRLHPPERHMLWHLPEVDQNNKHFDKYKLLIDRLRAYGLWPYWLSHDYHDKAKAELLKVDWSNVEDAWRKRYRLPLWVARLRERLAIIGSRIKQTLRGNFEG